MMTNGRENRGTRLGCLVISIVVGSMTVFLMGCVKPLVVSYSLAEIGRVSGADQQPFRVAVATFNDKRPEEEKLGEGKGKGYFATKDSMYRDVKGDISRMVSAHLAHAGLFQDVQPTVISSDQADGERLSVLAGKFDLVLVGDVENFYGIVYRNPAATGAMAGAAGAVAGLIGGLVVVGIESAISKDVEANVQLNNLQLVNTQNGRAIWKGQAGASFKRMERGLPEHTELVLEALKSAVTDLVAKLRATKLSECLNGECF